MKNKDKEKDDKKKIVWIKCPRCELNYIQKKDKCCEVCRAEMTDPNKLIPDEEFEEIICPVCRVNMMNADEEMCFLCAKEQSEKNKDFEPEEDDWTDDTIDADLDDEDEIPLALVEEEMEEEFFDDQGSEVDDMDYVSIDDDIAFDDDDDEDEEDEDLF